MAVLRPTLAALLSSVALALSGCATVRAPPATPSGTEVAKPASPEPPTAYELPCVPTTHGCIALNPDVTQETIGKTICVSGYTRSVRPSTSFSNGVKSRLLREAGLDGSAMSAYELDHLVPLALGGHPRKLSNLRLQPWTGADSAVEKDRLEVRLQHLVCRGALRLTDAQRCIAEDWHACRKSVEEERSPRMSGPRH